jgi:hypothetical protein
LNRRRQKIDDSFKKKKGKKTEVRIGKLLERKGKKEDVDQKTGRLLGEDGKK